MASFLGRQCTYFIFHSVWIIDKTVYLDVHITITTTLHSCFVIFFLIIIAISVCKYTLHRRKPEIVTEIQAYTGVAFFDCCRQTVFCRAMLCINAAYVVVRCPSVRLYCIKTSKHSPILKLLSWLDSHTILVFFVPKVMAIFRLGPWVGKNRDSRPISGFGIDDWWSIINNFDRVVIYSIKRGCPFMTQSVTHQWILFMTGIDSTPKRTEQFNCTHW